MKGSPGCPRRRDRAVLEQGWGHFSQGAKCGLRLFLSMKLY